MKERLKQIIARKMAKWAKRVINRYHPEVIGITGSVGKTSTKEAIYQVLSSKFGKEVKCSFGNLNNELGVPLSILGFRRAPSIWVWPAIMLEAWRRSWWTRNFARYLILEMAADKPGDIDYLVSIAKPHIAIVTLIGPAHLEKFGTLEAIEKEKGRLVECLGKDDIAILNKNDKRVAAMSDRTQAKIIYFESEPINVAREAAKTVGEIYGIPREASEEILNNSKAITGRMNLVTGINGSLIIDDCYNANPVSMRAALEYMNDLAKQEGKKRRLAILGDMLELGNYTGEAHREIARLAKAKSDYFVGVGPLMKEVVPDKWFDSADMVANWLLKEAREGDIILIKGSHGIHLERAVNALMIKR